MFNKLAIISTFLILANVALATPYVAEAKRSLVCANDAGDVCDAGYTCCGPIIPGVGGNCRKLKPGQVCIF